MKQLRLNKLPKGQPATVIKIDGGYGIISKLNALGIRKNNNIIKLSNSFIGGPVTVKVGNTKIAIGKGMCSKIIVEVNKK